MHCSQSTVTVLSVVWKEKSRNEMKETTTVLIIVVIDFFCWLMKASKIPEELTIEPYNCQNICFIRANFWFAEKKKQKKKEEILSTSVLKLSLRSQKNMRFCRLVNRDWNNKIYFPYYLNKAFALKSNFTSI